MTTKETVPPVTEEEVAAAEEARVHAIAVTELRAHIFSDAPLRLVEDSYVGIVGMGRRALIDEAMPADVQAELDLVFGAGKVNASDILGPIADTGPTTKSTKK